MLKFIYFICINSCVECLYEKIVIIGIIFVIVKELIEILYLFVDKEMCLYYYCFGLGFIVWNVLNWIGIIICLYLFEIVLIKFFVFFNGFKVINFCYIYDFFF